MNKRALTEKVFGPNWVNVMQPFVESEEWDKLMAELKKRKEAGENILPAQPKIFRAFQELDWKDLKVVVLGMDPYPTPGDACGLAFAVDRQDKPPKSLEMIRDAVEREMHGGLMLDKPSWPLNLHHWTEQGIMLLNSSLTVKEGDAGSHKAVWEPFINFTIARIQKLAKDLIFIAWGSRAQEVIRVNVIPFDHYVITAEHPAKAAYDKREWKPGSFLEAAAIYEKLHRKQLNW